MKLGADGTVAETVDVADEAGSPLRGLLDDVGYFGSAFAALGDVNGDSRRDFFVGAPGDGNQLNAAQGKGFVLTVGGASVVLASPSPLPAGNVSSSVKIANGLGGVPLGQFPFLAQFGEDVGMLEDLDADGVPEAVARQNNPQALYVMFLKRDGTVRRYQ